MMRTIHRLSGFTLIEIIVAIGVMSMVTMMIVPFYLQFAQQAKLTQDATAVYNAVSLAKSKARAGDGGNTTACAQYTGYRVTIAANSISTRICCETACNSVNSRVIATTQISTSLTTITSPPVGTSISFAPLNGQSSNTSIVIRNTAISKCQAVQVRQTGPVTLNDIYGC